MTSNCAWGNRRAWRWVDDVVITRGAIGAEEQLHMVFRLFRWIERFKPRLGSVSVTIPSVTVASETPEQVSPAIKPWFDPTFYGAAYPDVVAAGLDPLSHYITHGAAEMRDPNRWFSTRFYVQANPEVAAAGVNPLLHYVTSGHLEERFPSGLERQRIQDLGGLPPVRVEPAATALHVTQRQVSETLELDDWAE